MEKLNNIASMNEINLSSLKGKHVTSNVTGHVYYVVNFAIEDGVPMIKVKHRAIEFWVGKKPKFAYSSPIWIKAALVRLGTPKLVFN